MKFCLNSCKAVQIRSLWRTSLTGISQKKVGNLFQAIFFLLNFDNIATLNWRLFLPDNSQTSHYESFIEPKIRQKHSNEFSNVFFFLLKIFIICCDFLFLPKGIVEHSSGSFVERQFLAAVLLLEVTVTPNPTAILAAAAPDSSCYATYWTKKTRA